MKQVLFVLPLPLCLAFTATAAPSAAQISAFFPKALAQMPIAEMMKTIGPTCATQWSDFEKALYEVLAERAGLLAAEYSILEGTAPDYPSVCHVFSQPQIDETFKKKEVTKAYIGKARKVATKYEYYWPKYFVEVTEKGNDWHSTFSDNNRWYKLNRKLAASFEKLIDIDGAFNLFKYVSGANVIKGTVGSLSGISPESRRNPPNMESANSIPGSVDAMKNQLVLSPIQQMRLRSNKDSTSTSYEAAVWPIAFSSSYAQYFSVCAEAKRKESPQGNPGGYTWSLPMLPMTCPAASSRDIYNVWDTGMQDYLDAASVAGGAIGSNAVSCNAADAVKKLSDAPPFTNDTELGDSDLNAKMKDKSRKMDTNGDEMFKFCSKPLLGNAEIIAKQYSGMAKRINGPQCTFWGSTYPRTSTNAYNQDYGFANAALRFKLLAHDFSSLPRGDSERWSLAYPWEGPGANESAFRGFKTGAQYSGQIFKAMKDKFGEVGIKWDTSVQRSRAESLYLPGDPRLIDGSASQDYILDRGEQFIKEAAYLGTLAGISNAGGKAADELEKLTGKKIRPEPPKTGLDAINDRAKIKFDPTLEPIYSETTYCHRMGDRQAPMMRVDKTVKINYSPQDAINAPVKGPEYPVEKYSGGKKEAGDPAYEESKEKCLSFVGPRPEWEERSIQYPATANDCMFHGFANELHGKGTAPNGCHYGNHYKGDILKGDILKAGMPPHCQVQRSSQPHLFGCKEIQDALFVAYKKQEIIGWRKKVSGKPKMKIIETKCDKVELQKDENVKKLWICTGLDCAWRLRSWHNNTAWNLWPGHPIVKLYGDKNHSQLSKLIGGFKIEKASCTDVVTGEREVTEDDFNQNQPKPEELSSITDNKDTQKAIALATKAAPWVATEVARAKYADTTGYNPISGNRRIYTVWEKVKCEHDIGKTIFKYQGVSFQYYPQCSDAVKQVVTEWVQKKLFRQICDDLFSQKLGKPWMR